MWRQKLQTGVSFPMTQLDMSNYVVGPKSTTRYNLHAVSNHYGTMHGGHYTAFAKCVYDRKWYKFDDQYVTEMSTRDIVVCSLHSFICLSLSPWIIENSHTYSRILLTSSNSVNVNSPLSQMLTKYNNLSLDLTLFLKSLIIG